MELLNLITFYYINSLSYFIAFRFLLCLDHIRILHVVFKELIGIDLQHLKHAQPAKLYSLLYWCSYVLMILHHHLSGFPRYS